MQKEIEFTGAYAGLLRGYVAFRKGLGFVMPLSSQRTLAYIAEFLYTKPLIPEAIDFERAEEIASRKGLEAEVSRQNRYVVLRQLCLYLNRDGIAAYIPPSGGVKARTSFVPRVIAEEEMARIIEVAESGRLHWPSMVLKILWCTGIRIGEATALRVGDFDSDRQSLYIAHAKYDRSRIIPIHQTLSDDLDEYLALYVSDLRPEAWIFPGKKHGEHRNKVAVSNKLHSVYCDAGVFTSKGDPVRTHDVRHSFAIRALENMVERGQDVYAALPLLSAYMGHSNIYDTEYYLRLLPSEHQAIIDLEGDVSRTIFGGDT